MHWWVLIGLTSFGFVAASIVARWSSQPRKTLRRVLLLSLLCLFLAPATGIALGAFKASVAVGGEAVDPSQKARLLGEGIAEAMNFTALGVLGFFVPSMVALVMFVRAPGAVTPRDAA